MLLELNVLVRLHLSAELPLGGWWWGGADVTARILHGMKVKSVLLCDGAGSATW